MPDTLKDEDISTLLVEDAGDDGEKEDSCRQVGQDQQQAGQGQARLGRGLPAAAQLGQHHHLRRALLHHAALRHHQAVQVGSRGEYFQ